MNTLKSAKQPYSSPTGYATNKRCCDMRRTTTKIPDAAYVHQRMDRHVKVYPMTPLRVKEKTSQLGIRIKLEKIAHSRVVTTLTAPTPTIGRRQ